MKIFKSKVPSAIIDLSNAHIDDDGIVHVNYQVRFRIDKKDITNNDLVGSISLIRFRKLIKNRLK